MKKIIFLVIMLLLLFPITANARSGCCSHHGGVSGSCSSSGRQICNDGTVSPSCTCASTYKAPTYTYGCTDRKAKNYNPSANRSNGSCIYPIYGCTDSNAKNYNSNSNTDDKSCEYIKEINEVEPIIYTTYYSTDNSNELEAGAVITEGQNGSKEVVYTVVVDANGKQLSKKVKNEKIVKEAVPEVIYKPEQKETNANSNNINETETSFTDICLTYFVFYIFNYIYVKKSKDKKLIISDILKQKKFTMIFLIVVYVMLFFPMFIDSIIIITKLIKKLYRWKG